MKGQMKWVEVTRKGEVLHIPAGEDDWRSECESTDYSCEYGIFGCYMEDNGAYFCDAAHPPGINPDKCELCKKLDNKKEV